MGWLGSMVNNLEGSQIEENQRGNNRRETSVRITQNHGISHRIIRDLLKSALDPLVLDPTPTSVLLNNIEFRKDQRGEISITCDVTYETIGQP